MFKILLIFFLRSLRHLFTHRRHVLCLVDQSCPTLCNPMDCSWPGSSVHGDSPGKNSRVGCHALLQEIFPTQGWNPGLPHYRQHLSIWATRLAPQKTSLPLSHAQCFLPDVSALPSSWSDSRSHDRYILEGMFLQSYQDICILKLSIPKLTQLLMPKTFNLLADVHPYSSQSSQQVLIFCKRLGWTL